MILFLRSKNIFCYIPENESEQDILGRNKSNTIYFVPVCIDDSIIFFTPCPPINYPPCLFQWSFKYQSLMVGRLNFPHEAWSGQFIHQRLVPGVTGTFLFSILTNIVYDFIQSTLPMSVDSKRMATHGGGRSPVQG